MSDLRLSGLATGLDTRALITQLMAFERRPVNLMEQTQARTRSKINLYRQINTHMVALQRAAEKVMIAKFNAALAAKAFASDPSKLTATADASAASGTYTIDVLSLAKKQITGAGSFTAPTSSHTISDPSKYSVTLAPTAASGTYNVNILTMPQAQMTGNGTFNSPSITTTNSNPGVVTATFDSTAASGTYNVNVTSLAKEQITGGGAFTTPTFSYSSGANLTGVTVTPSASLPTGTNTYTLSNIQPFKGYTLTGTAAATGTMTNGTKGDVVFTMSGSPAITVQALTGDDVNTFAARVNTDSGGRLKATVSGGVLSIAAANTETFTVGGTANLNKFGYTTQTPAAATAAQVTITGPGGATYTATSATDDAFSAAEVGAAGLTGFSFSLAANTPAGSSSSITVTNTVGALRIANTTAGTFQDVTITAGMTADQVRDAINAANTGMTADSTGGKLTLKGNTLGTQFSITDANGTMGITNALGLGTTTQIATQASLTINGTTHTSATNTFNDPVTGIDLTANVLGSSTLTVANGSGTLRITNNTDGSYKDVSVLLNATASDVVNAINNANTGMTAAESGGKITLTANTTGVSYTVADASGGNAIATSLGIDSATKTFQIAQQASMTVNGGPVVSSPTTAISGGIPGVTVNALAPGAATLTVVNNTGSIRITNTTAGSFVDVAIPSNSTITAIASAINAANSGMTASVQSGKLVLTGNNVGDDFTIEDTGGGTTLANQLGIDSATNTTQTASLASISIDGAAPVTSTTNSFTNPLTGVKLDVLDTGTTTLTVTAGTVVTAQDEAEKKATLDAIRGMVTAFNDTMKFIKDNASYDTTTRKAGLLLGDSMAANLRSGLTRMFNEVVDDQSVYRTAHSAGIQLQRDGTLVLDEDKLRLALEGDSAALKALFTNEDGDTWDDAYGVAIQANSLGATGSTVAGDGIANRLKAFVDTMVANASAYNPTDGTGRHARGTLLSRIDNAESAIKDLDRRIESYMNRLSKRQKTLEAKFAAMEKLVALMRNQGNYMASQYMGMTQQP